MIDTFKHQHLYGRATWIALHSALSKAEGQEINLCVLILFRRTAPIPCPVARLLLAKVRELLICLVQAATSGSSSLPTALALWSLQDQVEGACTH